LRDDWLGSLLAEIARGCLLLRIDGDFLANISIVRSVSVSCLHLDLEVELYIRGVIGGAAFLTRD